MLKKALALLLVAALSAGVAVNATLAYLQDQDEDVNVMTLGNVYIEQHEYQRAENEDGTYKTDTIDDQPSYVLEDFKQGKPLLPIVGDPSVAGTDPAYAGYDSTPVRMSQVDSYGGMDVFAGKNAQDKFVTVENTGKSDAYVRTLIAIEVGSTEDDGLLVKTSYHFTWKENYIGTFTIEGNEYKLYEYIYNGWSDGGRHLNGVLPAGDTSYPNLSQIYLKHNATNEYCAALDGNSNGTLDILVLSQAVQTAGFEDVGAAAALDTAFGKVSEKAAEWFGGMEAPALVATADEFIAALENRDHVIFDNNININPANMSNAYGTTGINVKNGQTIDGDGNILDIQGAGGTWDSGISTTGGLIKNITVTGSFRGIFINHNSTHSERVVLENVTIDGTTYTISCDQGMNQGLTATNSTFNGWTSYAGTLGDAKFVDCSFGEGNGYAFLRPYAPTEFVGCEFAAGYTVDPRAAVTFENCTLDGVALTAANIANLVTDTANVTVK